jgi:hypothetical protein
VADNTTGGISTGLGFAMARRKAIRQTMAPIRVKHGLMHAPTIKHTQNGTGTSPPKFGVGGGYKSGGF